MHGHHFVGRAIRHKNDYATILLLDHRYLRPSVQSKLPQWISDKLSAMERFGPAFAAVRQVGNLVCTILFVVFLLCLSNAEPTLHWAKLKSSFLVSSCAVASARVPYDMNVGFIHRRDNLYPGA